MNIYKRLLNIIPQDQIDVGKVIAVNGETVTLLLQNNSKIRVLGKSTIGKMVYIKGKVIVGEAPSLVGLEIEV